MKILLTGGSGLLGTELQKQLQPFVDVQIVAPSHAEMDITNADTYVRDNFDIVIHCAAYTGLVKAEKEDKIKCYMVNVLATKWLTQFYKDAKFVYVSSEYASNPLNWYSWTKKWGEDVVKEFHNNYLIIRTLFKPYPFPHPKACVNQWTTGDYVDVITKLIIKQLDKNGVMWVGTDRKTTYELAMRTRKVLPCLVEDIKEVTLPYDYDTSS